MLKTAPWMPIDLDAGRRVGIDRALDEIARGIEGSSRQAGAMRLAEASLFFAYLGRADGSDQYLSKAGDLMDAALDALEQTSLRPALYGGIAEIGWILHHLGKLHDAFQSTEDRNEMVDEFLFEQLDATPAIEEYDLISGLVGFGVYFLERLPLASARDGLQRTVECLAALALHTPRGACWHTPSDLLPEWQRRDSPTGYYNFGMAHGIPGILVLLARCVEVNVARSSAGTLLEQGAKWLLAQEQDSSCGSFYPAWKERPDGPARFCRVAWCYGDPGPAWGIIAAGSVLRRPEWVAHGTRILEHCARRDDGHAGVRDAPLCHGAAGLLHFYHRASRALGNRELEIGAHHWLARTLEMRTPGRFVGGYGAYKPERPGGIDGWHDDVSFLTGVAGIGLALLACTSRVQPEWDRLLLLS